MGGCTWRTQRLIKLVDDLSARPTGEHPQALRGLGGDQAAYRLLGQTRRWSGARSWKSIPRGRWRGWPVSRWCCAFRTRRNWDFTTQPGIAGLGRLSYEAQHGLYASDPGGDAGRGGALGCWMPGCGRANPKTSPTSRKACAGSRATRSSPIWRKPCPIPGWSMADREGDLRALIDAAAWRGTPADHWLIRSQHNRKTTTGEKLWDWLAQANHWGGGIILPAAPDRPARRVRQTLYRQAVTLLAHHGQPAVTVTAILAWEEQPRPGNRRWCGDC